MFVSAISFAFLMGSLLGYRWLDIEYDQPGGGDPDIETDVHVGLYWTQSVVPSVNAFTNDEVQLITFQVTDNALFLANSYNTVGANDGPVEVRAATAPDSFREPQSTLAAESQVTSLSPMQDDEDINDTAGALMILAVVSVLLGFVLVPSAFAAHKEDMGKGCITAFYGVSGAMFILSALFSVASVLVFGGADLREAFCWRYEEQPSADSGLSGASCNYGASFYAAIIGAFFSALSAVLLFALVSPGDIQWVHRAEREKLDAAPAGAAKVSEMEKAAVAETKTVEATDEHYAATQADSKQNPPGTQDTSEGEKLAKQAHDGEAREHKQAATQQPEEDSQMSETEKVARIQAAKEAGATAPEEAGAAPPKAAQP